MPRRRHPRRRFDTRLTQPIEEGGHRRPIRGGAIEQILQAKTSAYLARALELADLAGAHRSLLDLVRRLDLGEPVFALELTEDLLATTVVVRVGDSATVGADARRDDMDVVVLGVAMAHHDERRAPVAKVFEVALRNVAPLRVAQLFAPGGSVRQGERGMEDGARQSRPQLSPLAELLREGARVLAVHVAAHELRRLRAAEDVVEDTAKALPLVNALNHAAPALPISDWRTS